MTGDSHQARVVLITGLSGAGKSSILRAMEDLGYEAVDNPPLTLLDSLVTDQIARGKTRLAIGVDARTSGFDSKAVLAALARLRAMAGIKPELIYAYADAPALLRRYTETRRRHPLAPQGRVADGIAAETHLTANLCAAADLILDTTDLPPPALRQAVEQHFGQLAGQAALTVTLLSFAFPNGLPREADMVFDARFLRNPHYDPVLRPKTGLDPAVGAYVEADRDYQRFFTHSAALVGLLLPRFVEEGKKYATIAVGCTGGKHRSVHIVEQMAQYLRRPDQASPKGAGWKITISHRELTRQSESVAKLGGERDTPIPALPTGVQAQEA